MSVVLSKCVNTGRPARLVEFCRWASLLLTVRHPSEILSQAVSTSFCYDYEVVLALEDMASFKSLVSAETECRSQ